MEHIVKPMNYTYQTLSQNPTTGIAQVQYAPDKTSLPTLVREVSLSGVHDEQQRAIAVSKMAPYPEWIALDPSITAPPVDTPFVVDPSRQPPTEQP
jgi:hypothetical protein